MVHATHVLPSGAKAIVFTKSAGANLSENPTALSFQTFTQDEEVSYLPIGRATSAALEPELVEMGSRGRALIKNLEGMSSVSELVAGLTFVSEALGSIKSDSKKDQILRYTDALYVECGNEIFNDGAGDELFDVLEKLVKTISLQGTDNAFQCKTFIESCRHVSAVRELVDRINSVTGKALVVPRVDVSNPEASAQKIGKSLIERFGPDLDDFVRKMIDQSKSPTQIVSRCSQCTAILRYMPDRRAAVAEKLEAALEATNEEKTEDLNPIKKMIYSFWQEGIARNIQKLGEAVHSESIATRAKERYQKEQTRRLELFHQWQEDIQDETDDMIIDFDQKSDVFHFNENTKKLELSFSDRWESLLCEVKQIHALGLPVNMKVQQNCRKAARFYRAGVLLHQVASFYNSIGSKMIPSTKPMLLKKAIEFEALIKNIAKNEKQMKWENPDELEKFARSLQACSEDFKQANDQIIQKHSELKKLVLELLNTDLIRQEDKWKGIVSSLREKVENVRVVHGADQCEAWLIHWDRQLYKVIDVHYKYSLQTLVDRLPEIELDLIFTGAGLCFRPDLETARTRFYGHIKRITNLPQSFRGLGPERDLFPRIALTNAEALVPAYQRAEGIFHKVETILETHAEWISPAVVDLDSIFSPLKSVKDFEDALREIKQKGKEAEKLPEIIKHDCITVSLTQFKRQVDGLITRCFNELCGSIKNLVIEESKELIKFISDSKEALTARVNSIDDITQQQLKYHEITKQLSSSMKTKYEEMKELMKLHQNITREEVYIGNLQSDWEGFGIIIDSYEASTEDKIEQLKSTTLEQKKTLSGRIEAVLAKWNSGKPTDTVDSLSDNAKIKNISSFITEKAEEMRTLSEEIEKMDKQLGIFELEAMQLDVYNQLKSEIEEYESNWSLIGKFEEAFGVFTNAEWVQVKSRMHEFQELGQKWMDEELTSSTGSATLMQTRLKERLRGWLQCVPALALCRGDSFSTDHWLELFRTIGVERGTSVDKLKLSSLLEKSKELNDSSIQEKLKRINERAHVEISIRESLAEVELWAGGTEFSFLEARDSTGKQVHLIKDWSDLLGELGDQERLISTLKESPHSINFTDAIALWEKKLSTTNQVISIFCEIQRKWLYLEPVFCKGVFATEKSQFMSTHSNIVSLLSQAFHMKTAVSFSTTNGLVDNLERILQKLQASQRALSSFLEEKRNSFSKFFFLGDDDLLEILGRPLSIQTHLRKLFAGIASLEIQDESHVMGVKSLGGEKVNLSRNVTIDDNPENWLGQVDALAKDVLKGYLRGKGAAPAQIECLRNQIDFCAKAEKAISTGSLSKLNTEMVELIQQLASQKDENDQVSMARLTALILDAVHHRDVVKQVTDENCKSVDDWVWLKQLRFYSKGGNVFGQMIDSIQDYSWEYQGIPSRLVHTSLTDKCFLTLTQALSLGLGGNPYGPAGTGKTESVKELGSLLGRHVLVFNCDEGLDVKSMGRIFMGLCRSGAWGCFDEFNRLSEIVLSAVSMDIQNIQTALMKKAKAVSLQNTDNELSSHTAIFVTLNPAGKGYGGRRKLPDNLKALFRPVAMSKPDITTIATVMLFAEGFQEEIIGQRLVKLFLLCRDLLEKHQHYDWGLRALKTVLNTAGKMLRSRAAMGGAIDEKEIAVRAVSINTTSKLTFSDLVQFDFLIQRVFPEVKNKKLSDSAMEQSLKKVCDAEGIYFYPEFARKCLELSEQLEQRIGVVVCGPPSSGKSVLWRTLGDAFAPEKGSLKIHYMNPKAVSRDRLLGKMDPDTREWTDGILTAAARQVNRELEHHHWIVCDGEIDPDWIEALNSVLDDNRLLTLPNGERIQFGNNVNFLFETADLRHASPATISRMGVIFLSTEEIDAFKIASSVIGKLAPTESLKTEAMQWSKAILLRGINWIEQHPEHVISRRSKLIRLLDGVRYQDWSDVTKEKFVIAGFKNISSGLSVAGRQKLAEKIYKEIGLAADLTMTVDASGNLQPPSASHDGEIVATKSLLANSESLKHWINSGVRGVSLLGNDGCGKSLLVKYCQGQFPSCNFVEMNCSSMSNPSELVSIIESVGIIGQGKNGRVIRPKGFDQAIILVRGVNIPQKDKWGTNMLYAFLTQLISRGGFYNEEREFVSIEKFKFIVTSNPSRGQVDMRLSSIVQTLVLEVPDDREVQKICKHFWKTSFPNGPYEDMASSTARAFSNLTAQLGPKEAPHYNFSLSHLNQWAKACQSFKSKNHWAVWKFEADRIFRDRMINQDHERIYDTAFQGATMEKEMFFPKGDGRLHAMDIKDLQKRLLETAGNFEREIRDLPTGGLVLSTQLTQSIVSVTSQLSNKGGNIVLIGPSGSGRRTAVQLGAYSLHFDVMSPSVTNVSDKAVKNFFRSALGAASIENKPVVILIESHHLENGQIFVYANSLLAQGTVPGLWSAEEIDQSQLRAEASAMSMSAMDLFVKRAKENIRLVLSLETGTKALSDCWNQCPALTKKSKIIVLQRWSHETLRAVANKRLSLGDATETISGHSVELHKDHGWNPAQYAVFLKAISEIYDNKKNSFTERTEKLQTGLKKLAEAGKTVAELEKDVVEQQKVLKEKREEADAALQAIQEAMGGAETQKDEMSQRKRDADKERENINKRKAKIEAELSEVQPLIDEAKEAIGGIKTSSLNEIRALRAPPEVIRDILEGVLKLMGNDDTSWTGMKQFLGKRGVKDDIREFDARNTPPSSREAVEALMIKKAKSFQADVAKRASVVAAPLAAWVTANVQYAAVLERIAPLEQEEQKLLRGLRAAELQVEKLGSGIATVEERVAVLRGEFEQKTSEAARLENRLEDANKRLQKAGKLIKDLSKEKSRWKDGLKSLQTTQVQLPVQSLLAAAHIVYLSCRHEVERNKIFTDWKNRYDCADFKLLEFLSTEAKLLEYHHKGMPNDQLSLENTESLMSFSKTPMLIDQSGRAQSFLKSYFSEQKIECVDEHSDAFQSSVELALRFGKTLMIENITRLSSFLVEVLKANVHTIGTRPSIKISDKVIDINPNFKLLLASKTLTYADLPSLSGLANPVIFSMTRKGLEHQLLSVALLAEQPELEEKMTTLVKKEEDLRLKIIKIENDLLDTLIKSEGNILDNDKLINSLQSSKKSAKEIKQTLDENSRIKEELAIERNKYSPLAASAATSFFHIQDIQSLDNMYTTGLHCITVIFDHILKKYHQKPVEKLKSEFIKLVVSFVQNMTSKDHEVPALLHLVAALFQREFPSPNWFNIMSSGDREFSQKLAAGERELSSWLASEYPENESPKGGNFSKVEQMAVIAQRRPDRFAASVSNFISRIADLPESGLGAMEFISQVGGAATPKLFILSGGADPSNDIAGLAEAQGQALVEAALEEDNDATFAVFKECLRSGKWLLLKNCHLASSWLEKLEGDLAAPDIHEDFRLWLTSESVPSFSPAILRRSVKMCVEAPPGLRRSMERISDLWPSRMSSDHLQLALLHSLILERKGFGSLGWSQEYDFTVADIRAALAVSAKMRNRPGITEKMLEGVIYGSRMHNPFDGNLLKLMVNETMSREGPSFGKFPKMISVKSKADALSYTAKLPASRNSDHLGLAKNSGKALAEHLVRESIRSLNLLARQTEHADSQWESAAANVVKHFSRLFSR